MHPLRRTRWPGGAVALLLFALQFVAAFGHLHAEDMDAGPAAASHPAAIAGGIHDSNDGNNDRGHRGADCGICAVANAFASFVDPTATAVIPARLAIPMHFMKADRAAAFDPPALVANARGPPRP